MKIEDMRSNFLTSLTNKSKYIEDMYKLYHSKLFDYSSYLKQTNISSIEIKDDSVIMVSRDKGVKILCLSEDYRTIPLEILNFLNYESNESHIIMNLISENDCVLDIGANIGWYSINIAKTYPSCTVHAFEPIPKTYSSLLKNIKLNKIDNIITHEYGLSDEKSKLTFYYDSKIGVSASSANLFNRSDLDLISCQVERLDDFVTKNDLVVDFIKCDVEGAELNVFNGGSKTIASHKPVVFTEMLRKWSEKFGYHPNDIINIFSSFDYLCFYSEGRNLKEIKKITDSTIQTNFFFLHCDEHADKIMRLRVV